jgi:hypothetical protein
MVCTFVVLVRDHPRFVLRCRAAPGGLFFSHLFLSGAIVSQSEYRSLRNARITRMPHGVRPGDGRLSVRTGGGFPG